MPFISDWVVPCAGMNPRANRTSSVEAVAAAMAAAADPDRPLTELPKPGLANGQVFLIACARENRTRSETARLHVHAAKGPGLSTGVSGSRLSDIAWFDAVRTLDGFTFTRWEKFARRISLDADESPRTTDPNAYFRGLPITVTDLIDGFADVNAPPIAYAHVLQRAGSAGGWGRNDSPYKVLLRALSDRRNPVALLRQRTDTRNGYPSFDEGRGLMVVCKAAEVLSPEARAAFWDLAPEWDTSFRELLTVAEASVA